jgi:hypothetical protein
MAVLVESTTAADGACEVAAGPFCVADASIGDEALLSLAKGPVVADGGACGTILSAPSEDWGPSVTISEEGDSSASEVAGVELALGARFLAFSCIAKHRNRCCSGSSMTGGGGRAEALVGPAKTDAFDATVTELLTGKDCAARATEGVWSSELFTRVPVSLGESASLVAPAFNAAEVRATGASSKTVADLAIGLSASAAAAAVVGLAVGAPELTRLSPD